MCPDRLIHASHVMNTLVSGCIIDCLSHCSQRSTWRVLRLPKLVFRQKQVEHALRFWDESRSKRGCTGTVRKAADPVSASWTDRLIHLLPGLGVAYPLLVSCDQKAVGWRADSTVTPSSCQGMLAPDTSKLLQSCALFTAKRNPSPTCKSLGSDHVASQLCQSSGPAFPVCPGYRHICSRVAESRS